MWVERCCTFQVEYNEAWIVCVDHCIPLLQLTHDKKRLQTLFKDQLDRFKATCSFKQNILLYRYVSTLIQTLLGKNYQNHFFLRNHFSKQFLL